MAMISSSAGRTPRPLRLLRVLDVGAATLTYVVGNAAALLRLAWWPWLLALAAATAAGQAFQTYFGMALPDWLRNAAAAPALAILAVAILTAIQAQERNGADRLAPLPASGLLPRTIALAAAVLVTLAVLDRAAYLLAIQVQLALFRIGVSMETLASGAAVVGPALYAVTALGKAWGGMLLASIAETGRFEPARAWDTFRGNRARVFVIVLGLLMACDSLALGWHAMLAALPPLASSGTLAEDFIMTVVATMPVLLRHLVWLVAIGLVWATLGRTGERSWEPRADGGGD